MHKLYSWGGGKILEAEIPSWRNWVPELASQFQENINLAKKSHKIGGRWENLYLDIDDVPASRIPIRYARDLGKEALGVSSVILFEPLPGSSDNLAPFLV